MPRAAGGSVDDTLRRRSRQGRVRMNDR